MGLGMDLQGGGGGLETLSAKAVGRSETSDADSASVIDKLICPTSKIFTKDILSKVSIENR